MNPLLFGLIAGLLFGAIDVALMIPMHFADKTTAMLGAFASRSQSLSWSRSSKCRGHNLARGENRHEVNS